MTRRSKYKGKWNNYTIGNVSWINVRRNHPSRQLFVEWVRRNDIKSIIEIGAGELTEAKQLKDECEYMVVDVSKVFLKEAKEQGFNVKKTCMCLLETPKKYDVIYMNSVLEHCPNLEMALKAWKKASKRFFITMFKWAYNGRHGTRSFFIHRSGYFSTPFDIDKLFELIRTKAVIEGAYVTHSKEPEPVQYKKYRKSLKIGKEEYRHRNGRYLSIYGTWGHTD